MRELVDSIALQSDQAGLRQRLAEDGYLFFRRLLRRADVQAAYDGVHAELSLGGWTDLTAADDQSPAGPDHGRDNHGRDNHGRDNQSRDNYGRASHSRANYGGWPGQGPSGPWRAGDRAAGPDRTRPVGVQEMLADPSFRAALASRGLSRLAYLAPLRGLVRLILGTGAFCYPAKVLRVVYPERRGAVTKGRYVHQDFAVTGVQDMLTTWLPLMDTAPELGGLAVLPGSHLGPPLRPRLLPADEAGWATTEFRPGDVLLFHCLTAHAALPNHADRVRISADFRWQAADQPAPAELVLAPAAVQARRGGPVELYSRLLGAEPWWEPVPSGLMLRSRAELTAAPPAPSRLFAVHPRWQRWRAPTAPVH
ncbi:MAG: phytanoyl-CoA dioxygenase family protein [Streptosporangiaceae bacterium]